MNDSPGWVIHAFEANNNVYVVLHGSTWLYDESNDVWIEKTKNPFHYHITNNGFSYNGTGYYIQDGTDVYKYDFLNDIWVFVTLYPGLSGNETHKISFNIGNSVYIMATFSHRVGGENHLFLYNTKE